MAGTTRVRTRMASASEEGVGKAIVVAIAVILLMVQPVLAQINATVPEHGFIATPKTSEVENVLEFKLEETSPYWVSKSGPGTEYSEFWRANALGKGARFNIIMHIGPVGTPESLPASLTFHWKRSGGWNAMAVLASTDGETWTRIYDLVGWGPGEFQPTVDVSSYHSDLWLKFDCGDGDAPGEYIDLMKDAQINNYFPPEPEKPSTTEQSILLLCITITTLVGAVWYRREK